MFFGYFPSGHFLFVLLLVMSTLFTPVLIPTDHHFLVAFTPSFSVSLFIHSSVLYFLSFLFSWLKHIFVPSFFLLRFVSCHSLSLHSFLPHFSLDLLLSQLFKHSLAAWQVLSAFLMASRIVAPAKWQNGHFPPSFHSLQKGDKTRATTVGEFSNTSTWKGRGVGRECNDGNPVWRAHPQQPALWSHNANSHNPLTPRVGESLFVIFVWKGSGVI